MDFFKNLSERLKELDKQPAGKADIKIKDSLGSQIASSAGKGIGKASSKLGETVKGQSTMLKQFWGVPDINLSWLDKIRLRKSEAEASNSRLADEVQYQTASRVRELKQIEDVTNEPPIPPPSQETGLPEKQLSFGGHLAHFLQSVGYGLLDKPYATNDPTRPKGPTTWDYLGRTAGQIGRIAEGSGLGPGTSLRSEMGDKEDVMRKQPSAQYKEDLRKAAQMIAGLEWNDPKREEVFLMLMSEYPERGDEIKRMFSLNQVY